MRERRLPFFKKLTYAKTRLPVFKKLASGESLGYPSLKSDVLKAQGKKVLSSVNYDVNSEPFIPGAACTSNHTKRHPQANCRPYFTGVPFKKCPSEYRGPIRDGTKVYFFSDNTVPLLKKPELIDYRKKPKYYCKSCKKQICWGHFNCQQCAELHKNDPLAFLVTVSVQGILTRAMAYITSTNSYGKRPIKTITIKKIPNITQERMLREGNNTIFIGKKHHILNLRKNNDGSYSGRLN